MQFMRDASAWISRHRFLRAVTGGQRYDGRHVNPVTDAGQCLRQFATRHHVLAIYTNSESTVASFDPGAVSKNVNVRKLLLGGNVRDLIDGWFFRNRY